MGRDDPATLFDQTFIASGQVRLMLGGQDGNVLEVRLGVYCYFQPATTTVI